MPKWIRQIKPGEPEALMKQHSYRARQINTFVSVKKKPTREAWIILDDDGTLRLGFADESENPESGMEVKGITYDRYYARIKGLVKQMAQEMEAGAAETTEALNG